MRIEKFKTGGYAKCEYCRFPIPKEEWKTRLYLGRMASFNYHQECLSNLFKNGLLYLEKYEKEKDWKDDYSDLKGND